MSTGYEPATGEEAEWAFQRAVRGYANDFIRNGILRAGSEAEAVAFVRQFQNGGSLGDDPQLGAFWVDFETDGVHAWFGETKGSNDDDTFTKGQRYVHLKWPQVVRRIRQEATGSQEVLF